MKSLPLAEWLWPLATAAAALLVWFGPRSKHKPACLPTRPIRPSYAELPTDEDGDEPDFPGDWCPVHHEEFHGDKGQECPGCREEWEQTWTTGEEPEEEYVPTVPSEDYPEEPGAFCRHHQLEYHTQDCPLCVFERRSCVQEVREAALDRELAAWKAWARDRELDAAANAWYLDLIDRSAGSDPHNGWRV
jgi:hypothetical protein